MTKQRFAMSWLALGLVAGVLGIALGACTKVEEDDNSNNTTTGSGGATTATNTATGKGGATATATNTAKGGATTTTTTTITGSGGSGSGGTTAEPCPDLLKILDPGDAGACSTTKVAANFTQINMLIVMDKSGSMNSTPAGYSKTKWAGAVDSLAAALKPTETLVKYGFMLYPYLSSGPVTQCELAEGEAAVNIGVGPAADTVPRINALMAATAPKGGTPTAAALAAAYKYYTIGIGAVLEGQKYVLLVTDGGPNCNAEVVCTADTCTSNMDNVDKSGVCGVSVGNCCDKAVAVAGGPNPQSACLDDLNVVSQIQALRNAGIKTFVVGIPGTEQYSTYLDTFADAGGVPVTDPTKTKKYYEVTGESGLLETFNTITTSLVRSCTVPLEAKPQDLANINVAIDCSPVPQTTAGVANWTYVDGTPPSIVFQGSQCTRIEATGVNRVDVVLGCVPYNIN
jgi:hypothetical protein